MSSAVKVPVMEQMPAEAVKTVDARLPVAVAVGKADAEPAEEPLPETISFNDQIQPILSEYCYHCHGPDSGTRE
ncbi:MAG: hypothetical protein JWO82_1732, partial [Akkermansiaceae bacterium]|nr:hypothetical protein [Akkermansiaceae bacterium]